MTIARIYSGFMTIYGLRLSVKGSAFLQEKRENKRAYHRLERSGLHGSDLSWLHSISYWSK